MSCNVVEMRIDHEVYLFGNEEDAKAASAAMLRGAKIYSPEHHSDRGGKVGIMPIETHVRRVCVGVSERKAVQALPRRAEKTVAETEALAKVLINIKRESEKGE